jgi:hypothetical protein
MTASYFPARHLKVVRQVWRCSLISVAVTGLPAMVLTYMAMSMDALALPAAIADAVFIICMWVSYCSVVDVHRHVAIIPYFQSAVGEIDTFCAGKALVLQVLLLDRISAELNVRPLSDFGYNDDICGERVEWHDPAVGLKTVRALLTEIKSHPERVDGGRNLIDDLDKLMHALGRANDQNIRFSLLLRQGNSTNALEWERRIGTAF